MAKHKAVSGFTMLESVFVLIILSICSGLTISRLPEYQSLRFSKEAIGSELLVKQTKSMLDNIFTELEFDDHSVNRIRLNGEIHADDIRVNGNGNIDLPQTIEISGKKQTEQIVIWLGPGRVEKQS